MKPCIHLKNYVDMKKRPIYCLRSTRNCIPLNLYISYYEGGISSCYFWDKDDGGFATAWLIRKGEIIFR